MVCCEHMKLYRLSPHTGYSPDGLGRKKAPTEAGAFTHEICLQFCVGRQKELARVSLALAAALTTAAALTAAETSALALIIAAARNDRVSDVVHRATN